MFDGSTTGRAFESELGFYLFVLIAVVTVVLWFVFNRAHRDTPDDDEDR